MLHLTKKSTILSSMIPERNIPVPMRDGVRLFANLFRPVADGPWAVVMSVTPYGKDELPDRLGEFLMRLSGVKFGKLNRSRFAGFESPDPAYWVENGYAVVQADVRGMHKSEGRAGVLRPLDAQDYYPHRIGSIAALVYRPRRLDGRVVSSYVAEARRGLEAAAPARDRSVGGSYRPIPGIRISWRNTGGQVHSHLVQDSDQARAQSPTSARRGFSDRKRAPSAG